MNNLKNLLIFSTMSFLSASCAAQGGATTETSPANKVVSFSVWGDHGLIPFYDTLDDDEEPFRTMGEFLEDQVDDHLQKNKTLAGFTPSPAAFEASQGGWVTASGMYPVAWAQEEHCGNRGCDFALMLGDNMYPDGAMMGADGVDDSRRFAEMLDKPYGKLGAGVPNFTIYSMMGNHDWRGSRESVWAQMAYLQEHPNFAMPNIFYRASPPGFEDEVEIFVIDTEMLLASSVVKKESYDVDGNEIETGELEEWPDHVKFQSPEERNMIAWLEESLKNSTAKWKIVAGHHALWSGGGSKFEKARTLRALYKPILCRHADAYFNGDDHTMEAYTDACTGVAGALQPPLPVLTSGAAGKQRTIHPAFIKQQEKNYPGVVNLFSKGQTWGFMHARIEGDELTVQILTTPNDMSGRPIIEAEYTFPRRSVN